VENDDHFVIKPAFWFFERRYNNGDGKPVPEGFEYNSGANPWRLTIKEMQEMAGIR
jgi:UDP-N-acetylglucosamine 4,6-dehydratase